MPRVLPVETPFWNLNLAGARRFELQERKREIEPQRQARDELLFAPILIEVRLLYGAQRGRHAFASQQAFVEPVPHVQGQIRLRRQLAFELKRSLSLPRPTPGDVEHPAVQRR